MHSVDSITDAATYTDFGGDTGMPVAGPGAPLVSEFSIVEFAAAIGLPTEAGKAYLGEAVELRYRLPRLWARVVAGDLVAWKARKTAKATIILSAEAAAFVDRHLAPVAHKVGPTQTDRLIDEAIARFMPDEAETPPQAGRRRPPPRHRHPPGLPPRHRHRLRRARPRRRHRPRHRPRPPAPRP